MKRMIATLILLLLGGVATAVANPLGSDYEASMVVTGSITVNPDGSVNGYALDQPEKLPALAVNVIKATVPNWKFQPVLADGKPVLAKTQMSLRIVAHPIDAQHATIQVTGANFGRDARNAASSPECANGACLGSARLKPPGYPIDAIRGQASGTVYVVIEIDRTGRVAEAGVRQVNLNDRTYDAVSLRKALANASLAAARDWTFRIPTSGVEAMRDHWIVQIPVNFNLGTEVPYGGWENYIPGPVQDIPWAHEDDKRTAANGSADALPGNNEPFVTDPRFVLLTPFGGNSPAGSQAHDSGSGS